jgi:hypothetical protein
MPLASQWKSCVHGRRRVGLTSRQAFFLNAMDLHRIAGRGWILRTDAPALQ